MKKHLNGTPGTTWGAVAASIAAALALAALLPLVYLFVDHLVWKGRVPNYADLPPARQEAFRSEWETLATREGVAEALGRVRAPRLEGVAPEPARWEWRWQAVNYDSLRSRVSQEAADAYLKAREPRTEGEDNTVATLTGNRLGVLSLIVRERPRWTASVLAGVARWNPWMWRPDGTDQANPRYLTGLFLIALVLAGLYAANLLASEYAAAYASLDAAARLRRTVFNHANRLGVLATKPQATAEVSALFTDRAGALEDGFRSSLTSAWRGPLLAVLLVAIIVLVNPWVGISFLLLGGLVWVVGGQMAAWYRRDSRVAARRADARRTQMRESLSMLQLVKSYLMDRFNQNRVERQLTDYTRSEWRRLRGSTLSGPALTACALLAAVVMLYLGGRAVLGGTLSPAGLALQLTALAALVGPVRAWVAGRVRTARAQDAAADVVEFLERRGDAGMPIDAEFLHPMTRKLEIVDVSYREPGTGRMVLENVTLSIPTGTRVAVVGSDRAEVHTLAFLLTRFLDPTAGEVRIDGKNLRWVTHESLRTQVALVMQHALVFNDSVANNIGCGDPGFTLPQIIEAAKVAHAHQFVQRLPYGYETFIGDAGYTLRPGEKLRIALARAILRDPSLIVVEEPDGPLDHDTKALLDDTFERLRPGRTLVILSRRQSVLRPADQVFVLHNGRLAASGTHAELMQTSDLYRNLLFQEIAVAGVPA
jgi:ABC-type multidrug transport system fused ATPase/permease subunit